jgi:hypothetical protein
MASQVPCPSCKRGIEGELFVQACLTWFANLDCVQFRCPSCEQTSEASLETGRVTLGYIYAAGSAHFAGMQPVVLPALVVERSSDGLKLTLDSTSRTLPPR